MFSCFAVFIAGFILVPLFQSKEHITLTGGNLQYSFPYDNVFSMMPRFTYFVESAYVIDEAFVVDYEVASTRVTLTNMEIKFVVYKPVVLSGSQEIKIAVLLTDVEPQLFDIGFQIFDVSTVTEFSREITFSDGNDFFDLYALSLPMVHDISIGDNEYNISFTKVGDHYKNNTKFSYVYITKQYMSSHVMAVFRSIDETSFNYLLFYHTFAYLLQEDNVFFGIRQYDCSSNPFMSNDLIISNITYSSSIHGKMRLGYVNTGGVMNEFNSDIFFFNQSFSLCEEGQYIVKTTSFNSLPSACANCDLSCSTCIAPSIPTVANQSCLTCYWLAYLAEDGVQCNQCGPCSCYIGLNQINGTCQPCQSSCLQFKVVYIKSTNQSNFLLSFSYTNIVQNIGIKQNMRIQINGKLVDYNYIQQNKALYHISIALEDMKVCSGVPCDINFLYKYPQHVLLENLKKSLSMNNVTVVVDDYVDYYSALPQSLKSAFLVMNMIVGASMSGGMSSMLKMLFEIEQIIEFHKHLNLSLPIIFDSFLDTLINFRVLDLTTLAPSSLVEGILELQPLNQDTKGTPKLVFYDNGVNFYKNMILGVISFFIMLLIYLFIYFFFYSMPCKLMNKFSQKMKIRRLITVHDTFDQMVLPICFFALFQFSYLVFQGYVVGNFVFAAVLMVISLVVPFLMTVYVFDRSKKQQSTVVREVYEDLLHDNSLDFKVTFVFYIITYYRKVFMALVLATSMPGLVQVYIFLTMNIIHFFLNIYIICFKVYLSKIKIVIRTVVSLCIMAIQVLIIVYNVYDYEPQMMIKIGFACLYLALLSTILSLIEILIKLFDLIFQKIRGDKIKKQKKELKPSKNNNESMKNISQSTGQLFNKKILCNIGKNTKKLTKTTKNPPKPAFDKELMDSTFNHEDKIDEVSSIDSNILGSDSLDLVYIEEDQNYQTFAMNSKNDRQQSKNKNNNKVKQTDQNDLYEIPEDVDLQLDRMRGKRSLNKKSKYQVDEIIFEEESHQYLSPQKDTKIKRKRLRNRNHKQINPNILRINEYPKKPFIKETESELEDE